MPTLKRQWTAVDLDDLPDDGNRYEVIDGELFVTPAPALRHQAAVLEILAMLREYLLREPVGYVFGAPVDVVFSHRRSVQPDACVMPRHRGGRPERFQDVGRLLLAVEVLSPSTARADRVEKRRVFREEGVPEYWVIDLDARAIERSTPAEARVELLAERLVWHPDGAESPLVIELPQFFARALDD